jgi:hypothetical protein
MMNLSKNWTSVVQLRQISFSGFPLLCTTQQNVRSNAKQELQQNHHTNIEPKTLSNAMNSNARNDFFSRQRAFRTEIVRHRRRVCTGNIASFVLGNTVQDRGTRARCE